MRGQQGGHCRFSEGGQPAGGGATPVAAGVQWLEDNPLQRGACGAVEAQGACPGGGPAGARVPRRQLEKDHQPRGGPGARQRPALEVGGPSWVSGVLGTGQEGITPAAPWTSLPHRGYRTVRGIQDTPPPRALGSGLCGGTLHDQPGAGKQRSGQMACQGPGRFQEQWESGQDLMRQISTGASLHLGCSSRFVSPLPGVPHPRYLVVMSSPWPG